MPRSTLRLALASVRVSRRGRTLFEDLSLELRAGEALRIEGPNGSGKSTLLKVLAGLLRPDGGRVVREQADARPCYIGHLPALRDELTVTENLENLLAFGDESAPRARRDEALRRWSLDRLRGRRAGDLSAGQRRRLGLAPLSVTAKAVWLLDEPSTTLDAEGTGVLRREMAALLARGGSVAFSAHDRLAPDDGEPWVLQLEHPSRAL